MQCALIRALIILQNVQMQQGLGIQNQRALLRIGWSAALGKVAASAQVDIEMQLLEVP